MSVSGGEQCLSSRQQQPGEKLAAIKRKYDPDNLFRFNQNIPPAA